MLFGIATKGNSELLRGPDAVGVILAVAINPRCSVGALGSCVVILSFVGDRIDLPRRRKERKARTGGKLEELLSFDGPSKQIREFCEPVCRVRERFSQPALIGNLLFLVSSGSARYHSSAQESSRIEINVFRRPRFFLRLNEWVVGTFFARLAFE